MQPNHDLSIKAMSVFRLVLPAIFLLNGLVARPQKTGAGIKPGNTTVTINLAGTNSLNLNQDNLLILSFSGDSISNILVTASQGNPAALNRHYYKIIPSTKAPVTIKVYDTINGGRRLLVTKTFPVVESAAAIAAGQRPPKPAFDLEGYAQGDIPLSVIRQITRFQANPPFRLVSLIVSVHSNSGFCYQVFVFVRAGIFDATLRRVWAKIQPGHTISLTNIFLADPSGQTRKVTSAVFKVVAGEEPAAVNKQP